MAKLQFPIPSGRGVTIEELGSTAVEQIETSCASNISEGMTQLAFERMVDTAGAQAMLRRVTTLGGYKDQEALKAATWEDVDFVRAQEIWVTLGERDRDALRKTYHRLHIVSSTEMDVLLGKAIVVG